MRLKRFFRACCATPPLLAGRSLFSPLTALAGGSRWKIVPTHLTDRRVAPAVIGRWVVDAFQPPSAGSLVLNMKGDLMERLSSSDWLILRPALSHLADDLRSELDLIAHLDAMCTDKPAEVPEADTGRTVADVYPDGRIPSPSARAVESLEPINPIVFKVFREVDEKLRKLKLTNEADWILERYRSGDTAGALEYVEALRGDLTPEGSENDTRAGNGDNSVESRPKGVSLQDAAACLEKDNPDEQKVMVRQWQNSRAHKLPESIGKDPENRSRKLYEVAALLAFLKEFCGESEITDNGIEAHFRRRSRHTSPR